jgi:tetratricopeptide (TPR) repeat protein
MSTAWSGVHDYVSWAYLYAALAGLAVVVGGVLDWLWPPSWSLRNARAVAWTVLCLVIVYYASQQVRINVASGSAEKYWLRVLRLNPRSESASLNLGRFYLQRGEVTKALGFLFSPPIEDVGPSCLAVSHYYSGRGDYLAAAIHLRTTAERKDGILFQQPQMSSAALFTAAGAPDYAEGALGSALMADPFNTKAMGDLAEIWLLKGYVNAAEGCVDRMLRLSPRDERARVLKGALEAYVRSAVTSDTSAVINPPPPRWLRYLVQEGLTGPAIVRAGEEHPDDPIVQVTAATYLMQHGELQLAKTKLDKAAQSLVSSASLWARKCWVDTRMGAYAEAEAAGKRALELNPTSSAVHNALGVLWSTAPGQRRDLARAEQHYRRTLDLSPVQASVHVGLGNVLVQRGKVDEGIQHYRQALGINENLVEAQENLGLALLGQGKLDEAMVHLERALQIDPESATAHYSMGFALLRQGKIDQAAEHSRKAFQVKPDYVEAYTQLGRALARKGDLGQAARYLQEALRISPNDATAHNNLGVVLAEQHNLDEAVTHYSAALRASPGFREAYNNLGMALIAQGRYGDAIQAVQGWLEVVPQDVNEAVRMAWLLATCPDDAYRNGMEAARLAQEICDVTKYKHTNALDALAAAHAEMGRFDTAVQFATRAREMALSKGREQLAKDIGVRIQMYNDRRPYRLAP